METIQLIILVIFILAIVFAVKFLQKKKVIVKDPVPALLQKTLAELVPFYQQLTENKQAEFEQRAAHNRG
jgi:Mlc titration factor MtfA (ptsG expression regulator)